MPNNPYYDPQALGDYLARTRGQGITPEFTNIPGASGFQIGTGIKSPAEEDEEDEVLLDLPPIESFIDKTTAYKTQQILEQELNNEILARRQELEAEKKVPQLLQEIEYYKSTGLRDSDLVRSKEAALVTAYQEADIQLAIGTGGRVAGLEAPNYRARSQYNERLKLHAQLLEKPEKVAKPGELTSPEKIALSTGLGLEGMGVLAKLKGKEVNALTEQDLAGMDKDDIAFIQNEIDTGGETNLPAVLVSAPKSMDLLLNKLEQTIDPTELPSISADLKELSIKSNKARQFAGTLRDAEGVPLSADVLESQLLVGTKKKEAIKEAQDAAVNRVLVAYENKFRNSRFNLATVDLGRLIGTTPAEQQIIQVIQPELEEYIRLTSDPDLSAGLRRGYRLRLQTTLNNAVAASPLLEEITTTNPFTGQKIIRSKSIPLSIHAILQKIAITAREQFNTKYKSSLGIGAAIKHLPGGTY